MTFRKGFINLAALLDFTEREKLPSKDYAGLSSTTYTTLNSNGQSTITFTRTFDKQPCINLTETNASADDEPLFLRVTSWTLSGGKYTGCTIQGLRARELPTLNTVSGVLTAVVDGVNAIVTALSGYSMSSPANASGAMVSVHARQRSD